MLIKHGEVQHGLKEKINKISFETLKKEKILEDLGFKINI